jgi:dinuclear metal center YbgI/SA1388 family protein
VNVADLVGAMEDIAPTRFAAPWDNVGLLVGDAEQAITRVLLTVDCTRAVLREAVAAGCEAVVSYHPPIFEAQKRFVDGSMAFQAARAGIAVFSPHTALDVADGGTNDVLADATGMIGREPLRRIEGRDHDLLRLAAPPRARGFGRVGQVAPIQAGALVERVKQALGVRHVLMAGAFDRGVSRVAVCAGSGADLLGDAMAAGADLFLSGELRHRDALRATEAGMAVVCTRHSISERAALVALERALSQRLPGVAVTRSQEDHEPFQIV